MDAYALSLKLRTDGFEQAVRKLNDLDTIGRKTADNLTKSAGISAQSLARVASRATAVGSAIAAAGEVGTSALNKITNATANLAIGFGPQGALVAATAIATTSIVSIFTRARDEMAKTASVFRAQLRSIRAMSAEEGAKVLNAAVTGDVLSDSFLGRFSKGALERGIANLQAQMKQNFDAKTGQVTSIGTEAQRQTLEALNKELENRNRILREGLPLLTANAVAEANAAMARAGGVAAEAAGVGVPPSVRGAMPGVSLAATGGQQAANALSQVTGPAMIALSKAQEQMLAEYDAQAAVMQERITDVFGDAIAAGFTAAFTGKGIGGAFKELTKSILAGLGQLFIDLGKKMILGASIIKRFTDFMMGFNGIGGIAMGIAMIGLGSAMAAMGGGGGGRGGAGSGGGYEGGYSPNSMTEDVTRVRLFPGWAQEGAGVEPRSNVTVNATIIGVNDPAAQRQLNQMIQNAQRQRG